MDRMEASIITTYRCTNRCQMCHIWKFPTKPEEEFRPSLLKTLPKLSFCNITGGEPFLRDDIDEITHILIQKAKRIVISTNGYFVQKILDLGKKYRTIGIRISVEGLSATNAKLRGTRNGFDRALTALIELKRLGLKDIGFGITVSDRNAEDLLQLYQLSRALKMEFATAVVHNSYYFHKYDNRIVRKEEVIKNFKILIIRLLKTWKLKNWYRAYFNSGLIDYIQGKSRLLPCGAGTDMFFLDPWGEIRPCNGMEESLWFESMGNLNEKSFEEIWNSEKAKDLRKKVKSCPKNCWMIGTASPAIKRNFWKSTSWVLRNKIYVTLKNSL
jgi:radical SAM protein with 4Fe4S-binding SPASM domain